MIVAKYRMMRVEERKSPSFGGSLGEDPKFTAYDQKISRGEANTRTYSIGSVIGIGRYLLSDYRNIAKSHIGASLKITLSQ